MRCLKLDVRILSDTREEFRRRSLRQGRVIPPCLAQDRLVPMHFVSLPGLSFVSAFKMTAETIYLLQGRFMYKLFGRDIRRGLTFVNTPRPKQEVQREDKAHKKVLMYID